MTEEQFVLQRKKEREVYLDAIRGCLIGGAAGDALGYSVEFWEDEDIFAHYGPEGITQYTLNEETGKAQISDDTQMTLFTAVGLLFGETRGCLRGIRGASRGYVAMAYRDWLLTQQYDYDEAPKRQRISWLLDVPELFARRAPGTTCLIALQSAKRMLVSDFIADPANDSKGCGGVMRIAPVALNGSLPIKQLDMEAAQIAAITHGHSLGYMTAAVLCHIINRIVYPAEKKLSLQEIVAEAVATAEEFFAGDAHLEEMTALICRAVELSKNQADDLENIRLLGQGWVAEETLAIAIYCSLRYEKDFSGGIIAAVNHSGDSDSTGAVTGNILGALLGYGAIEEKWKQDLECAELVLEIADDLCYGCQMREYGTYEDPDWTCKYVFTRRKEAKMQ